MKRKIIPYKPYLKDIARKLRKNMTPSEVLLWDQLKQKKMLGYDFDRQRPIYSYIVDFYCKDLMLAIEIDGVSHDHEEAFQADQLRQNELEKLGVQFLRFDDDEVKKDMDNVLRTIEIWIEQNKPNLTPPKRGFDSDDKSSLPSPGVGKNDLSKLLEIAKKAAREANSEILKIYESGDFGLEAKSDNSPLTLADRASHNTIIEELKKTEIPILSEEGKDISFRERSKWEYFWMVDPLDGTKEFVKRNGEFTVNIALIKKSKVVMGVVTVPVTGDMYYAISGTGAYKNNKKINCESFGLGDSELRIVASRSHLNEDTEKFINGFQDPVFVSKGSSLKLLMVAEGNAHLYPRFAPTMEWDTAAAQIIVEEAGGSVTIGKTGNTVVYNKENLLNPYFLVTGKIIG